MAKNSRIIAVCAILTFGVGFLGGFGDDDPSPIPSARWLVGVGFTFSVIAIMNDLGSPAGAGFAILVAIAATITQGEDVIKILNKSTGDTLLPKTGKHPKGNHRQSALPPGVPSPSTNIGPNFPVPSTTTPTSGVTVTTQLS